MGISTSNFEPKDEQNEKNKLSGLVPGTALKPLMVWCFAGHS
jgi:hypothetical protein